MGFVLAVVAALALLGSRGAARAASPPRAPRAAGPFALEFQRGDGSWLFGSLHDSEIAAHTREKRWRDYIRKPVVPTLPIKATRVRPVSNVVDAFGVFIVDAAPLPAEALLFSSRDKAALQRQMQRLSVPLYGRYVLKPVRVPADTLS